MDIKPCKCGAIPFWKDSENARSYSASIACACGERTCELTGKNSEKTQIKRHIIDAWNHRWEGNA